MPVTNRRTPSAAQDRLLLMCRVLGLVVLAFHGGLAKDAELLMLRHENAVLPRQAWCGTSQLTGPGSPRWRGLYRVDAGPKSSP